MIMAFEGENNKNLITKKSLICWIFNKYSQINRDTLHLTFY